MCFLHSLLCQHGLKKAARLRENSPKNCGFSFVAAGAAQAMASALFGSGLQLLLQESQMRHLAGCKAEILMLEGARISADRCRERDDCLPVKNDQNSREAACFFRHLIKCQQVQT